MAPMAPIEEKALDLYKEPGTSQKVGFQAPDLAMTRHY